MGAEHHRGRVTNAKTCLHQHLLHESRRSLEERPADPLTTRLPAPCPRCYQCMSTHTPSDVQIRRGPVPASVLAISPPDHTKTALM